MLPAIALALQLAQFAPSLMKLFGSKEPTVETAQKVIDTALQVTSTVTGDSALARIQSNSGIAFEFELAIRKQEMELVQMQNADRADARNRDIEIVKVAGSNNRANWLAALAIAIVVLIIFFLWANPELNEFTKGVITTILGVFLQQIATIYNFEFGYTRGKQTADKTIESLSKSKEGE